MRTTSLGLEGSILAARVAGGESAPAGSAPRSAAHGRYAALLSSLDGVYMYLVRSTDGGGAAGVGAEGWSGGLEQGVGGE